jgi:hypothetical protein
MAGEQNHKPSVAPVHAFLQLMKQQNTFSFLSPCKFFSLTKLLVYLVISEVPYLPEKVE